MTKRDLNTQIGRYQAVLQDGSTLIGRNGRKVSMVNGEPTFSYEGVSEPLRHALNDGSWSYDEPAPLTYEEVERRVLAEEHLTVVVTAGSTIMETEFSPDFDEYDRDDFTMLATIAHAFNRGWKVEIVE